MGSFVDPCPVGSNIRKVDFKCIRKHRKIHCPCWTENLQGATTIWEKYAWKSVPCATFLLFLKVKCLRCQVASMLPFANNWFCLPNFRLSELFYQMRSAGPALKQRNGARKKKDTPQVLLFQTMQKKISYAGLVQDFPGPKVYVELCPFLSGGKPAAASTSLDLKWRGG